MSSNTTEPTVTYYECVGGVRGRCGVLHPTYEAAERHCRHDDNNVKRGHGRAAYSDRRPVPDGQQYQVDGLYG
jgi:hypothetical protein